MIHSCGFITLQRGPFFPDEYCRLNKRTQLLIESRPAVTCGTKQTHPENCEQTIPTSWLFVHRSHPQWATPMRSPCFTPCQDYKNAHDSHNITFCVRKLWNNRHHAKSRITWISFNILILDKYCQFHFNKTTTAASTGTISPDFTQVKFSRSTEEAPVYQCYHFVYITPISCTCHYIIMCMGYAHPLCKTDCKQEQ